MRPWRNKSCGANRFVEKRLFLNGRFWDRLYLDPIGVAACPKTAAPWIRKPSLPWKNSRSAIKYESPGRGLSGGGLKRSPKSNKFEKCTCVPAAALPEARHGVCHFVASCAWQMGHSYAFQGTDFVSANTRILRFEGPLF